MDRNDALHWFILGFGLSGWADDFGRPTNLPELWEDAKEACFDCSKDELLDALYTLPREHASLIKFVPFGEGLHPVSFERVRNTVDWPDYFASEPFSVKVLAEGRLRYRELSEQLENPRLVQALGVRKISAATPLSVARR